MESPPFDFEKPIVDPIELSSNLIETMKHYNAMGLAANQCGMPLRVFAMHGEPPYVCFNPKVVYESDERANLVEGCLTYPNLWIKIKRADNIRVRFQDPYGNVCTKVFGGYDARCFLHELDHLNGVTFLTRADRYHLEQARRKQKAINRKSK
jgi:peptide deformylase